MDGWMNDWNKGWMDGWMDDWMDGWMNQGYYYTLPHLILCNIKHMVIGFYCHDTFNVFTSYCSNVHL